MIERFAAALNDRDVDTLSTIFTADCTLEDAGATHFCKEAVLDAYRALFARGPVRFEVVERFTRDDGDPAFVFELGAGDGGQPARGVCCLNLRDGRICRVRYYLAS